MADHQSHEVNLEFQNAPKSVNGAWIFLATAMTIAALIGIGWGVINSARLGGQGRESHIALCTFRSDLRSRLTDQRVKIARTEAFISAHPDGIPGIPAKTIKQGLADDKQTLRNLKHTIAALNILHCERGI